MTRRCLATVIVAGFICGCGGGDNAGGGVNIQAPGVSIEAGPGGTKISAPGIEVKADPSGTNITAPGVKVESKP